VAAVDALQVTGIVARALEDLGVRYLVGGSLASSLHGIPRSTQDADLVADLEGSHAHSLVSTLQGEFYIDQESVEHAIGRRSSFNVIHLPTMFKVDIFVLRRDRVSELEMRRRQQVTLELPGGALPLWVATAEDTVLQKLVWYREGHGVSDRQWQDLLGVLKVQKSLDMTYVEDTAEELGVGDLLERALGEAGRR
jgi:hypothetical protein